MVKLRSRLIRSPFSGGSNNQQQASASSSTSPTSSSTSAASAHFNGRNQPRRRNNSNSNNNTQQRRSRSHSQRLQSNSASNNSIQASVSDQRRPFQSLPSAHSLADSQQQQQQQQHQSNNSGSYLPVSPRGKRKPENRGLTASIRRAKTAMLFRMGSTSSSSSSSPMNNGHGHGHGHHGNTTGHHNQNQNHGAAAAAAVALGGNEALAVSAGRNISIEAAGASSSNANNLGLSLESSGHNNHHHQENEQQQFMMMDTSGSGSDGDDDYDDGNDDHESHHPSMPRILQIQRSPSQEENVPPLAFPPLALSSPNICGGVGGARVGVKGSPFVFADVKANTNGNVGSTQCDDDNAMVVVDDINAKATSAAALAATALMPLANQVVTTNNNNTKNAVTTSEIAKNVLEWMREDAPPELLPKLLSFCGSRKMNALSRVNKAWNAVMKDESVWRVVCEDTHKWTDEDEVPNSWAQFYKQNPCVPIDYDTVDAAFESISSGQRVDTLENNVMHSYREQRKACRILLHPGPYFLRKPLVANVVGNVAFTIEAVTGVVDPKHAMTWRQNYSKPSATTSMGANAGAGAGVTQERVAYPPFSGVYHAGPSNGSSQPPVMMNARRPSSPTLRQIFAGCGSSRRSSSSMLGALDTSDHHNVNASSTTDSGQSQNRMILHQSCFDSSRSTPLLCLESRCENEPVIRVRQGTVNIRGIKFVHYCEGTDIWNGNAAVQVQRAFGRNGRPLRVEAPNVVPTANVSDCEIMSLSGRGLVVIDGAMSHVDNCNFHGSAATGVYVGGAGSMASMTRTDVVDNGVGNTRRNPNSRGVARGHSGIYVEQGLAKIHDCNISGNTLTGISAISTAQARLHIEESDIRGNRSDAMELPPEDSGRSVNRNNSISRTGRGRPRSQRLIQSVVLETPRSRAQREPSTPQSPLESDDEML